MSDNDPGDETPVLPASPDVTASVDESQIGRLALQMRIASGLSGGISHTFGNVLQAVETNLTLAKMSIDDRHRTLFLIEQALGASRKGATVIADFLGFSRQQVLDPHRLDLNRWLDRERDALTLTHRPKVKVTAVAAPASVEVIADEARMTDAVVALIDNACKAMPAGGTVTVSVGWRDAGAASAEAEIAVRDTGVGMSNDVLSHAVEPFFTTREVGQGCGLGLSMAYGFACQSGGTMEIHSEVGAGTTVFIRLPVAPAMDHLMLAADHAPTVRPPQALRLAEDAEALSRETPGKRLEPD